VAEVFSPTYAGGRGFTDFPAAERAKINAIVMHPTAVQAAVERIGGQWREVERYTTPLDPAAFYDLVVLRRQ
jgi:hypothetical protein